MSLHEQIVNVLKRQRKPVPLPRLASLLHADLADDQFREAVLTLRHEGLIYAENGDRYASALGASARRGYIRMTERGYGFVEPEGGGDDVLVPAKHVADAVDGDFVLVAAIHRRGREGLHAGRVLGVIERPPRTVVGAFHRGAAFSWIHPDERALPDVSVSGAPDDIPERVRDGDKVIAELEPITLTSTIPSARVVRVLGSPTDPWTDIQSIVYQFGLRDGYPAVAEQEAARLAEGIPDEEIRTRRDLRGWELVTIDPEDAADIDDAVSLVPGREGRSVLGIHIADVSRYVTVGGAIDEEALARGTSVYLPGKVIHMLPRRLSEGLCSLRPGVDLPAMSVLVTLGQSDEPVDVEIVRSVIRSRAKLTYEQVQAVLDGQSDEGNPAHAHATMLRRLARIAARLTEERIGQGALDFDVPEVKVEVDADGRTVAIHKRERRASHRLIEELMLLANRTVAHRLAAHHYDLLYRVHAGPDPQKLREVAPLAAAAGHTITPDGRAPTVKELQALLRAVEGEPIAPILETLIIRSLPKAVYQPENIGHFALAADQYTHFTSPIRRYPDLVVHRQLSALLDGKPAVYTYDRLVAIGRANSEAEQVAEEAERSAIRAKQVELLGRHLGEEFDGVISGVRKFGLFVMLNDSLAEGLVSVDDLDADSYRYDPSTMSLTGRRHRGRFGFGDPVTVQVVRVDTAARRVDFVLVAAPASGRKKKSEGTSSRSSRREARADARTVGRQASRAAGRTRRARRSRT